MSKKEKPLCPVCMNHYTSVIRQPIVCAFCPHSVCRQCASHYLLTTQNDPHCMECKREWNREFIDTHLTQTFRKGPLKLHRRKVLMDRERGRLPAMQLFVEAQTTITENSEKVIELRKERKALKLQRNEIQVQYAVEGYDALAQRLDPILKQLSEKKLQIRELQRGMWTAQSILLGKEKAEARQFIMKCPAEDCRGFLSSAWKCGTCQKFFCSDCHAEKSGMRDEDHTCNAEAKATAAMIRQETKPCPKCGIRISKIDGCDQMWCTGCHTTFSWNSGQILLNTVVHNPHYYEYLRKTNGGAVPREAGDIPCGGLPDPYLFQRIVYDLNEIPTPMKYEITDMLRGLQDIFHARLPQYPLRQNANINRDIDIAYLMKKVSEEEWGSKLEQAETRFERKKEIGLMLQTLVHVGSEKLTLVQNAVDRKQRVALIPKVIAELDELRDYMNQSLLQKGIQMGIVVPQIQKRYQFGWFSRGQMKEQKQKGNQIVYPGQEEKEEDEIEEEQADEVQEPIVPDTAAVPETVMVDMGGEIVEMAYAIAKQMMLV